MSHIVVQAHVKGVPLPYRHHIVEVQRVRLKWRFLPRSKLALFRERRKLYSFFTSSRVRLVLNWSLLSCEFLVERVNKGPVLQELPLGDFIDIKVDFEIEMDKGLLEVTKVGRKLILIFGVVEDFVRGDRGWKIMI